MTKIVPNAAERQTAEIDAAYMELAEAARRVHRAMYDRQAITGLSSEEQWLVELDHLDAQDRGVADEWQKAVNKDDQWQHQCANALQWLKDHELPTVMRWRDREYIDRRRFEAEFGRTWPGSEPPHVIPTMSGPWWNVVQAIVWLATYDDNMVDLVHVESTFIEAYRTIPCVSLDAAERQLSLEVARRDGIRLYIGTWRARAELAEACARGVIQMRGRLGGEARPDDIPVKSWSHLVIHDKSGVRPIRAATPDDDVTAPWWTDLRVSSVDVRRHWPAPISAILENPPAAELPLGRRGAAAPIIEENIVEDMLQAAREEGDTFSVRAYVLKHDRKIPGPNLDAKIRRLQRKFNRAIKSTPA